MLAFVCALFVCAAEGRVRAVRSGTPQGFIANADAYSVGQGKALSIPASRGVLANDRDPDRKPLIAILVTNPTHGALTFNPDGRFIYTNDGTGAASDVFSYQASNGTARSNIALVTITIGAPDAVTAVAETYSLAHGATINVPAPGVLANDIDPEGAPLIAMPAVPPTNGSLALNANGSFVYTHHGSNTTSDSFAYRATNGLLTSTPAIVSLNIGLDVAPVVTSQRYSIPQNATLNVPVPGVLAGAIDPDSPSLTAILQTPAAHGVVTLDPKGGFIYQPSAGYSGADSFTYRANDGILTSNEGTASITVNPPSPPLAASDRYVATTPTLSINAPGILGNDTLNGATLISYGVSGTDQSGVGHPAVTAQNGQITLNADGSFTYNAPSPSFAGEDTFRYAIGNPAGTSTATVTVTVANVITNCPSITITTPAVPAAFTGVVYPAFSFAQTGGAAPVMWSATGALPPGMQLSNSGVLSGTPTAAGSFSFTITVTDANGCSKPKVFTLNTSCSIAIAATVLAPAKEGAAYAAVTLSQTGGTGAIAWSIASGRLPAGMSLSSTGVISGAPSETGSFPFTVKAMDGAGCWETRSFSLTVNPRCPTMTITTTSLPNAFTGVLYPAVSFGHSGGVAPITWSSGALPPGMVFSSAGVLSGTPAASGVFNIRVTATDASACAVNTVVPFTVVKSTCPVIAISGPPSAAATQGTPYKVTTLTASGGAAPYMWSIAFGTLPPGMSLSPFGVLSGTPSQSGTFPIIILATDANGCFQWKPVSFVVASLCKPLDITGDPPDGTTGAAYPAFNFTQSGGIEPVTWSAGAMPLGMNLSPVGVLSGMPLVAGNYNLALTIVDANGCSWTEVVGFAIVDRTCPAITIDGPDATSATQRTPFTAETLTASGGASPYTWSIASGALPPGMSLSPFGVLSGTPTQSGTFEFTVVVTDANGCTNWTPVSLVVDSACATIDITSNPPDGTTGAAYTAFGFTQSGGTEPVTWSAGAMPPGMTFSSAGVLAGTPLTAGNYNLTITATDGDGCSGTEVVAFKVANRSCGTITISGPNSTTATVGSPYTAQTLTASGGTSPYTWSIASGTLPPGMTLSPFGVLSGTPTQSGTFPFTVLVTDANGCTNWQPVSLVVICRKIDIAGNPPNGTTGAVYTAFKFTQSGGAEPVTWSAGAMPAGMELSSSGVLSGTPTIAGDYNLTITTTDANRCTGTKVAAFKVETRSCGTITISGPNSTSATVGSPYTAQTLTASGGTSPYTWSIASGTLPPGMTLSPFGVLSGTPTQSGTFTATILATDVNGCTNWKSVSLVVASACDTIVITGEPPAAKVGAAYSTYAFSHNSEALPVTWSAGPLPEGMSFSTDGVLSGTPAVSGEFTLYLQVTDANGCIATLNVDLTIDCPDMFITASATVGDLLLAPATVGAEYGPVTFTATGAVGTVVWRIIQGSLPAGLTFSNSGSLSGTPVDSGAGTTFKVEATDQNGCTATAEFTIGVDCEPRNVTPDGSGRTITAGQSIDQDFDVSNAVGVVSWSLSNAPAGITIDGNGRMTGSTTQVFASRTITIRAAEASGCADTASYFLTVNCNNILVSPDSRSRSQLVGQSFGDDFTVAGNIGGVTWSINLANGSAAPGWIRIDKQANGAGRISGTPPNPAGFVSSSYDIRVRATDANGCFDTAVYGLQVIDSIP